MNCPVCKESALAMSERLGVEIDYCPQCRGVWLDRGELDKVIQYTVERQMGHIAQAQAASSAYASGHHTQPRHGARHEYSRGKSFLERLFD
jgi:Zn-finger nucleic acid-binding protein